MTTKSLSVAAIENGTVIDHIPSGVGVRLLTHLHLLKERVTVGFNLPSDSMGEKDLIKVEGRLLSEKELGLVAVLAQNATVNIIEDYRVVKKFKVKLPQKIEGIFSCPNRRCITHHEKTESIFEVKKQGKVLLTCLFCEKSFHDSH